MNCNVFIKNPISVNIIFTSLIVLAITIIYNLVIMIMSVTENVTTLFKFNQYIIFYKV